MLRKFTCAAGLWTLIAPVAGAITVTVSEKSQPESITVAPNGDLILGSMGSSKIYRAQKGSDKAKVFIDAAAEGAVFFLGATPRESHHRLTAPHRSGAIPERDRNGVPAGWYREVR